MALRVKLKRPSRRRRVVVKDGDAADASADIGQAEEAPVRDVEAHPKECDNCHGSGVDPKDYRKVCPACDGNGGFAA